MNYYERHLGDYAKDTAHLSLLEHGVYTVLLDQCYSTEDGIRADDVYRLARARTKEEREAVDVVLKEFFTLVDGKYRQKRCDAEIERARARIEAARQNGRSGGRPRKADPQTYSKPSGFTDENPGQTHPKPSGFSDETQAQPSS
ncbi:MAG: YdaU family protein, partial [Steroidobacteraceae bacterium]